MADTLQLGELAFTAEEIKAAYGSAGWRMANGEKNYEETLCTELNRILAEKLGRATAVYGREALGGMVNFMWTSEKFTRDTHTARLVCLEKIVL
jgi:hypothetical protein